MVFRSKFSSLLMAGAGALCLISSPARAECIVDSEPLADDFSPFNSGSAIIHKESGFVFPAEVAGFKRECEMTTDFTGDNFQIRYVQDAGKHKIEVDIVVIHLVGLTAKDHYLIIKPDMMSHYSSSSTISEGDYFVSGRPDITAYQGIFDGEKDRVPWHFSLSTLGYGYWDARLIASYPQEIDSVAQEALMELITAFQWQTPKKQQAEVGR